jgi:hypothetical protein
MTDGTQSPGAPPVPPATPQEARSVLDSRIADKDFGARLVAGDADANCEFRELQAKIAEADPADDVARALAGDVDQRASYSGIGIPDSGVKQLAATAEMLREIGVSEPIIAEQLHGHEVTAQEMKAVEAWRGRQMKNPEFVKAYLSGEPEARKLMTLSQIVISGGIKGEQGRF